MDHAPGKAKVERKSGSKSELTRQRFLDAAAFVLARKGYSDTRLEDIANCAGSKAGSLYYYFSSRDELVAEVMATGVNTTFKTVMERLHALPSDASSIDRLRAAMETHLLCLIARNDYSRAVSKLASQAPKNILAQHAANERVYGKVWKKLLRDARSSGQIRDDLNLSAIRMLILGAMSWSVEWYKPENGPAEAIAHDFCEMVLHGLEKK